MAVADKTLEAAVSWNIEAAPTGHSSAVQTVIGLEPGGAGPWSFVTDAPRSSRDMVGPPALYLAIAGWGACTVVTVTGVAHRGKIPLERIDVDFEVEAVAGAAGFGVRKRLILTGKLSDSDVVRIRRAADYCPVGQLLTKGAMELEDEVIWASGDRAALGVLGDDDPPTTIAPVTAIAGRVQCRHLVDTKVTTPDGVLHEGEVKSYLSCENRTRPGRWCVVAGHSHERWVPAPNPLAQAGLAASTVDTLRQLLAREGLAEADVRVAIAPPGASTKDQAQSHAAEGKLRYRQAKRRVSVPGSPATVPIGLIREALNVDPLSWAVRRGGILLAEEVVLG